MNINNFKLLTAFIALFGCGAACASAETLYQEVSPSGEEAVINLDPSMAGKTLKLFAAATNPNHQTADIVMMGIGGERMSVESFTMNGAETAREALEGGSSGLPFWFDGQGFPSRVVPGRDGAGDSQCGCLTDSQKVNLLAVMRKNGFPYLTTEGLCWGMGQAPGGVCAGGAVSADAGALASTLLATSFVPYNRCVPTLRHGVAVVIDFSGVPASVLEGKSLRVAITMRKFRGRSGSNWATFKISDGKKFPGWISLTEVVSPDTTLDDIRFVTWQDRGKSKSEERVRKASRRGDYVYYGSKLYRRTPISGLLTGGKGTVEVSRYGEGYSFCAKFTKKNRQNFNGYRKMGAQIGAPSVRVRMRPVVTP
jgi:hypothetical protein